MRYACPKCWCGAWGLDCFPTLALLSYFCTRDVEFFAFFFLGRGAILRRKSVAKSSYVLFLEFKRSLGVCYP